MLTPSKESYSLADHQEVYRLHSDPKVFQKIPELHQQHNLRDKLDYRGGYEGI
jgi:hypothetical protein